MAASDKAQRFGKDKEGSKTKKAENTVTGMTRHMRLKLKNKN